MNSSDVAENDPSSIERRLNWLKNARAKKGFVRSRPDLARENSSNDLISAAASQNNSRSDLFQSSRLNLFDTAPAKSEITTGGFYLKGISPWISRTKLEKILIVVVILCFFTIIGCLIFGFRSRPLPPKESDLCLSAPCIYTASEVIRSLDQKVDPCDDFYEFACGGWIKNNPLPEGKSSWSIFSKLELQNQLIIKNAIEKVNSDNSSKAEQKAKIYYESCMDANGTVEALGGKPLLKLIEDLGGWHLLPETKPKNVSLQDLLQKVQNDINLGGFFNWEVAEDDRNSSKFLIVLDQGGLTLPTRDYYLNKTHFKKVLDSYLQLMVEITVLLGADKKLATEEMQRVIDLETEIALITTPSDERRDEESLYNPTKLQEFNRTASFIDWGDFFNDAFKAANRTILPNETIVVYAPQFFKNVTVLVEGYKKTDQGRKTLQSYLLMQACRSASMYLSKSFRDTMKILKQALMGSDESEEEWRFCVTDTTNTMGFAVGAMFVRDVFQGSAKAEGEVMVNNIRDAFIANLRTLEWMDPETRKAAELKADAIDDMIGFPDYILDPLKLDAQYNRLEIKPNAYFENHMAYMRFSFIETISKLDKTVNRNKWGMFPCAVNAYYTPTKNQIVFPAGILQLPFYDGRNPRCINYGAMGVVMGHELTHGFDDQGREYDRFGNLHRWWQNSTIAAFKQRAQCFEKQYSSYKIDGSNLNGKQTLGENMADNGGLKAAFRAYVKQSETAEVNYTLPGVPYNHRQIFFISFAQVWCSVSTKEDARLHIEKDDHTVSRYRVMGPLSNLKEFSEEFHCPLGSRMNPHDKCEVW